MGTKLPFTLPARFTEDEWRITDQVQTPEEVALINRFKHKGTLPTPIIGEHGVPELLTDPLSSFLYCEGRRRAINNSVRQRPMLRLWDKNHNFVGRIASERSVRVEELMADSGAGSLVIQRDHWLGNFIINDRRIGEDLHFTFDPIPTQRTWRTRWGGKVTSINAKRDRDGLHTIEMEMVSNREHAKHILAQANPILPPEFQLPRMFMLPMNLRSGLSLTMILNLARQYHPLLSIPTNIVNPFAWIGVGLKGFNPLSWPIQVAFVNPITDTSRFEVLSARWNDIHTVSKPLLEDAGCMLRAYTWLQEDEDSPHPELEYRLPLLGIADDILDTLFMRRNDFDKPNPTVADLARPTRNCVIFSVEDKSGVVGPTGTAIDGVLNLIAATADNAITEVLLPNDKDKDGKTDPLFRKWFMVAPKPGWVTYREHEFSGIVESQRIMHASTAKTVAHGGRSPGWVNQAITFGIKYGLAQLSSYITYVIGGYETPGTPGLEEMYQGQLDDSVLAYQKFTDARRALENGDLGFLEYFDQTSGTAYVVSGLQRLREAHYKTRAHQVFKVVVRNGVPFLVNLDYTLGDRLNFEIAGVLHTDQLTGITYFYDRETPLEVELTIGDDQDDQDPVGAATRAVAAVWNMVGMFMGAQDLF